MSDNKVVCLVLVAMLGLLAVGTSGFAADPVAATIFRLPSLISDGMVLQRDTACPIWGWAPDGVTVKVTFRGAPYTVTAKNGQFRVDIKSGMAGGPFPLVIDAGAVAKVTLQKVFVGEVWLYSGQSNMDLSVAGTPQGKTVAAEPAELLHLSRAGQERDDGSWFAPDAQSIASFSAVAFYMGKALARDLRVPIGLIQRDVCGTAIQSWIPQKLSVANGIYGGNGALYPQWIQPCQPYAMRGVVWYQGESNANEDNCESYQRMLSVLISSWRADWGQGDFPFLIVQLPAIRPSEAFSSGPFGWAYVREAQQRVADTLPNTGLVVTCDVTNGDLHPSNKKPMGERAALLACRLANHQHFEDSGPLVMDYTSQGNHVILHFTHTGKDLLAGAYDLVTDRVQPAAGNKVTDIRAVMVDGASVPVDAAIDGNTVVVDLTGHRDAVMLSYDWQQCPTGNLYNDALLPAAPFRLRTRAVTVVNGGFELPTLELEQDTDGAKKPTPGWIFAGNAGDHGGIANGGWWTAYHAPEGQQQAYLAGTASMSQVLHGLVVGRSYLVTFYLARANQAAHTLEVLLDHTPLQQITPMNDKYNRETCRFTAKATDQTLRFVNNGPSNKSSYIDDVQVRDASFFAIDAAR